MYRISVSMIEKFRRYMVEETGYDTEEALVDCIAGKFEGNDKTKFGHGFHALLEGKFELHKIPAGSRNYANQNCAIADGVIFPAHIAAKAIHYRAEHPRIVYEVPMVPHIFETHRMPVLISGRVDALEALRIRDAKCKFRSIDVKEYLNSSQWKFYCHILQADEFVYDLFEVRGFEGFLPGNVVPDKVNVIHQEPIVCHPYPGMEDELQSLVNDFIDYIHNRNHYKLLKEQEPVDSLFK